MTLDPEPSTPVPPNTGQVIDRDDEMEAKLMEDYYDAKIDHNHSDFPMILETVKEERRDFRASVDLFITAELPYT